MKRRPFLHSVWLLIWLLCAAGPAAAADYYLPPEYAPAQAVMVSAVILEDENGYRLLQALLQSQVEIWLLSPGADLESIKSRLRSDYGLPARELARIRVLPAQNESIWARDWAPLMTLPRDGQRRLRLLDAMYFSQRPRDDAMSAQLIQQLQASGALANWHLEQQLLPLHLEGGNIMCTQATCLMTERTLQNNRADHVGSALALDASDILKLMTNELDQNLQFVPQMPLEPTGHIDMWAKLLDERTVLIAQLLDQTLALAPPAQQAAYRELQAFLEAQALGHDAAGKPKADALVNQLRQSIPNLRVLRVPLPLSDASGFRSYTNSLLVNGRAILPRYLRSAYGQPYPDRRLLGFYEQQVEAAYASAGFEISWIEADYLIPSGGAWHCATMQVPALAD